MIARNITIHSLEEKGGLALDLDTVQGRAVVMIWAIMADLFTQQLSESIRSAIAWRKANGLVYYGQPSYGRRRMRLRKRSGERKGRLVDVWDEKEVAQIREIKRRHDEGESIPSIAADFHDRHETTARPTTCRAQRIPAAHSPHSRPIPTQPQHRRQGLERKATNRA